MKLSENIRILAFLLILNTSCNAFNFSQPIGLNNKKTINYNGYFSTFSIMSATDEVKLLFNEEAYLLAFPDVKKAANKGEITAYLHYIIYGQPEGRLNYQAYINALEAVNKGFNEEVYLLVYPDIASGIAQGKYGLDSGYKHYETIGKKEKRIDSLAYKKVLNAIKNSFNEIDYLKTNQLHTYTFTGSYLTYTAEKSPDQGIASISVDGIFKQSVDLYSATRKIQDIYKINNLSSGNHYIDIKAIAKNNFSSGYGINIVGFSDTKNKFKIDKFSFNNLR